MATDPRLYNGVDPFTYHRPDERQVNQIEMVRTGCRDLLATLISCVPSSAERTLAIRKLEEVSMWANKAIVFEPTGPAADVPVR